MINMRQAQQAAGESILGKNCVPVHASGSMFFNINRWTARILFGGLCKAIELGNGLDKWTVANAVANANATQVPDWKKKLNVAAWGPADSEAKTRKPQRVRIAGVYHEAWHTKYSCTRDLTIEEVWGPLQKLWNLIPDPEKNWPKLVGMVLHWGNLIEDIRIERRGCEDHPGAGSVMPDLQDFILEQEGMGLVVNEHRASMVGPMQVIAGTFRDLGLGYETPTQRNALIRYTTAAPQHFELVNSGELRPLLDRAINMTREDDLGHWWLAMEVVAFLFNLVKPNDPPPTEEEEAEPEQGEGEQGEGEQGEPEGEQGEPEGEQGEAGEGEPGEGEAAEGDTGGEGEGGASMDFPEEDQDETPNKNPNKNLPMAYKVGDRAEIKATGQVVEVVSAGLPDPVTGVQQLQWSLVEE